MARAYEEERVFAEQLDKALAGQAMQISPGAADDLRTALEFSQRMVNLRPDPRLQFRTVLKVNLIQQLKEKEERQPSGRSWFWSVMPREPIWQATLVLAIMLVVGGVIWGTLFHPFTTNVVKVPTAPTVTSTAPAPTAAATTASTAAPANPYLAAQGSTDKPVYQSGEPVKIEISWQNLTSQDLTINEFPPIVSLMETSDAQPVYTFAAGKSSRILTPGQKAVFSYTWDQRDAQGNLVAPGRYYLELEELYYNGQAVKMDFSQPVNFDISIK